MKQRYSLFLSMVVCLLPAVLAGPSTGSPVSSASPFDPLHVLISLIPKDKVFEIERNHLEHDEGFKSAVKFLQSKNWTDLVDSVLSSKEYKMFHNMTRKYNFKLYEAVTCLREHIESLKIEGPLLAPPNLASFISDLEAIIPIPEIAKMLATGLRDPQIVKLRSEIASKENKKIAETLHKMPQMKKMRAILREMKFDVDTYISMVYTFLGWGSPLFRVV
ncbi:uncharacterized protein LOC115879943 [Sitophilus oryzae]|uniref:Uncharacterized protein LOC115879943 n=1 Tax=Sitophilus oryzae TaxID=7048 RepID=A0A6J2XPT3_SITOR|nr:uncharacterized protein LOC115879943 [Sitophilus oryzae]